MIDNIKNDEISLLCGIPKEKKLNIINKIINKLNEDKNITYLDYEINKKEINKIINKNIVILTNLNINNIIKDIKVDTKYIILNYPGKINNQTLEVIQNYAHEFNKRIVLLSDYE